MEEIRAKPGRKSSWTDTEASFKSFLDWLDNGEDTQGRSYLEMRRRLVAYFDRKNCSGPDLLADETLSRVSRRLEEEGSIKCETPAQYCYITARYVFLEHVRTVKGSEVSLDDVSRRSGGQLTAVDPEDEGELRDKMLDCLDNCSSKLDADSRDLIYGYYFGKSREKIEHRRSIAEKMGITVNALAIKACRIRTKLQACVGKCAGVG